MHADDDAFLCQILRIYFKMCRLALVYAQHATLGLAPRIHLKTSLAESKITTSRSGLIFPVPHLLEEVGHVDFLCLHLKHPRVVEHTPGRSASGRLLFETVHR